MALHSFSRDDPLINRAQAVVEVLKQHRLTTVTAESCTAGLIAAALSCAPGASDCLHGGFVVYTKQQKSAALGVAPALLQQYGSVSAEVAQHLARGALERSPASIAIAITGVVGPNPDEDGARPGQVFFAIARKQGMVAVKEEYLRFGTADEVRGAMIERALDLLRAAATQERRA